ncbi:hypothetical protein DACRYDRAFT_22329 [Dacryopinax primogenitus]|uniref:TPR-like protein n=1 Tax=Dacryopinax primogenitus (strain DJM 731) TaxID=1858805 RepID=M5G146_DACPD|nr:uncharacterized protein DACRYDRAFT_22329 [Dacryopinax primogenitus]EJU01890.1 hypothetical protein DACRYDRAFT_22329 [Dacryopinax primogenitus]
MKDSAQECWNELDLAYEYAVSPKGALNHAKHLLSLYPSSMHLWDLYADLEQALGKLDAARRVYQILFKNPTASPAQTQRLWYKWATLEWKEGAMDSAITILCQSVLGGDGQTLVRMLKAKQMLSSMYATHPTVWVMQTRALLTYLTSSDLTETLDVLSLQPHATEELHAARSRFLLDLARNRGAAPIPPAALRGLLEQSAKIYPDNPSILSAFAANESRETIRGRVHRLFETLLNETCCHQSLEFWSTAVMSATSVHEKREWLDRGVRDEMACRSLFLWQQYVQLELENGRVREAKSLLYRGVSECPWSKDLYLIAFHDLMRPNFETQELIRWIDVMVERGLRLRVEWAGIAEDHSVDQGAIQAWEDDTFDDAEWASNERQRLLPY